MAGHAAGGVGNTGGDGDSEGAGKSTGDGRKGTVRAKRDLMVGSWVSMGG